MKILQANKAYLPHIGGIETVVRQLAEGFAQTEDVESSVIACSDDSRSRSSIINGVDVKYCARLGKISSLPISPSFSAELMASHADILLIHEPSLLASLAYSLSSKSRRTRFNKVIVWWHSDIIRQKFAEPFYKPLHQRILALADAIIVATPNHITSSIVLPGFNDKCQVIHFGYEQKSESFSTATHQRAAEIRSEIGRPIVLFVGRLVYYKGAEYLAKAAQLVPDAEFVFVGKGPLLKSLSEIAKNGSGNVRFIPYLSDTELDAYYEACHMLVLPSVENSEAFGLVQLDAMAHAKPVITSDLPTGVTYINQNNKTGLVVPRRDSDSLADAIRRLIIEPSLCESLGKYAQYRINADFRVDSMVDRTVGLFRTLLGR